MYYVEKFLSNKLNVSIYIYIFYNTYVYMHISINA